MASSWHSLVQCHGWFFLRRLVKGAARPEKKSLGWTYDSSLLGQEKILTHIPFTFDGGSHSSMAFPFHANGPSLDPMSKEKVEQKSLSWHKAGFRLISGRQLVSALQASHYRPQCHQTGPGRGPFVRVQNVAGALRHHQKVEDSHRASFETALVHHMGPLMVRHSLNFWPCHCRWLSPWFDDPPLS